MEHSQASRYSPKSTHSHQPQSTLNVAPSMSLPSHPFASNYPPMQGGSNGMNTDYESSMLLGNCSYHFAPVPSKSNSPAFTSMTLDPNPASQYPMYRPGSYTTTNVYTSHRQYSHAFESTNTSLPRGGALEYNGPVPASQDRDVSGSPESRLYADVTLDGTFMELEHNEMPKPSVDYAPECPMPQLTSPANQRAADARRKRKAKYSCDMCGSKLTAKHNLTSHMNAHFGIKPFRCPYCQKEYTAKSTFRRHVKTVHQDKQG